MSFKVRGMPIDRAIELKLRPYRLRKADATPGTHSFFRMLEYRKDYWKDLAGQGDLTAEVYPEFSKLRAKETGIAAGVAVPRLIDGPISVSQLRWDDYGDSFVVKPDWGASSRGVLVLNRLADGSYRELYSNRTFDRSELTAEAEKGLTHNGRGLSVIVEESILTGQAIGWDWKVFAFHGEVGLFYQRAPVTSAYKYYTPQGLNAGNLRSESLCDPAMDPPKNLSGLIDAAERISLQVPTGFVRVDLYERTDGEVLLGELCLIPGMDLYFLDGWDLKLGQMWHDANVRLLRQRSPLIP